MQQLKRVLAEKKEHVESNEQAGILTKRHQSKKARGKEVRHQAMEHLGKTQKRNVDSEEENPVKVGREEVQMPFNT